MADSKLNDSPGRSDLGPHGQFRGEWVYRFSFKAQQFDNYKNLLIITKIINLIKRSKFVRG